MLVTSDVKAEGDQPSKPRCEGAVYLFEYVALGKQSHTHTSNHPCHFTIVHLESWTLEKTIWGSGFTLPELSDACCDEAHGEAEQVVFGALLGKLLWLLKRQIENVGGNRQGQDNLIQARQT